jgi:hypothetical protein
MPVAAVCTKTILVIMACDTTIPAAFNSACDIINFAAAAFAASDAAVAQHIANAVEHRFAGWTRMDAIVFQPICVHGLLSFGPFL